VNEIQAFDAIKATAEEALAIAKTVKVTDADSAAVAKAKRDELKTIGQRVEEIRKEQVKPIDEAREKVQELAKSIAKPLDEGKKLIEGELMRWQAEERAKAEAAAEAERKAAEARLAETISREDATIEEIERLEEQVQIQSAPVKMGKSYKPLKTRENWKFAVRDFRALVEYALKEGKLELLISNDSEIGRRVRAAENPLRVLPGVEIYSEQGVG